MNVPRNQRYNWKSTCVVKFSFIAIYTPLF